MRKKVFFLFVLISLFVIIWIKFFYKTYQLNVVPNNADCIVVLDTKKIINQLIWNFISTPSQWKKGSAGASKDDEINWKDVIKIPDYLFLYNLKNSNVSEWYTTLEKKDKSLFEKYSQQQSFKKIDDKHFYNDELKLYIFTQDDYILISNTYNVAKLDEVVNTLYIKKQFKQDSVINKLVSANSQFTAYIPGNTIFEEPGLLKANFNKKSISITANFVLQQALNLTEQQFNYNDTSLCTLAFSHPNNLAPNILNDSAKNKLNKMVGFNMDSVFLSGNHSYQLDFTGVTTLVDSAITYSYDDNFNKIEKVVLNKIENPNFSFKINSDSSNKIFKYWADNQFIEKTNNGDLLKVIPLVKTFVRHDDSSILINTPSYISHKKNATVNGVLFFQIIFSQIPRPYLKYLPSETNRFLKPIHSLRCNVYKTGNSLNLKAIFTKKDDVDLIFGF